MCKRERSTCHLSTSSLSIRNIHFPQENAGEDDRALNSEQIIIASSKYACDPVAKSNVQFKPSQVRPILVIPHERIEL